MIFNKCVLTGDQLEEDFFIDQTIGLNFTYTYPPVGKVIIAIPTLLNFINSGQFRHPILSGICRNAFEQNIEPPIITQDFINNGLKNISYPKSFKEKWIFFLKILYDKGGNEFKSFNVSTIGYPICYADDEDEFLRIIEYLKDKNYIKWIYSERISKGRKKYENVQLTDDGIDQIEKDLPNIPLIGLLSQSISTGYKEIDEKINYAKDLFFKEPQTINKMRSACETLSYVLEPLRENLKNYFNSKDSEDFFNIVNNFDIRHNKEKTKNIQHPEQLEWIYYSLLNTITIYTKLKLRIG